LAAAGGRRRRERLRAAVRPVPRLPAATRRLAPRPTAARPRGPVRRDPGDAARSVPPPGGLPGAAADALPRLAAQDRLRTAREAPGAPPRSGAAQRGPGVHVTGPLVVAARAAVARRRLDPQPATVASRGRPSGQRGTGEAARGRPRGAAD